MKCLSVIVVFAAGILGVYGGSVGAATLVSQPPENGGIGVLSTLDEQNADNIGPFATGVSIDTVRWWGAYIDPNAEPDDFLLRIYRADGGFPDESPLYELSQLTVTRVDSGLDDQFGDTIYEYEVGVSQSLTLFSSQVYFLSLINEGNNNGWFWSKSTGFPSQNWFRESDAAAWQVTDSGDLAFTILGEELPELPGDFDLDGDRDGFDFLKWQRGKSPNPLSASDLADWETNYGMVATLSATSAAVPEPNSLALLCLGGLLSLRSFRRVTPFTA